MIKYNTGKILYHPHTRAAGFSVLEAIIVLAITGMALTLIFSIGSRASDQGFRLGRRALAVNDRSIAVSSIRLLITAIRLPHPTPADEAPDPSFVGEPDKMAALVSLPRPTVCTPSGRVLLTLSLTFKDGRSQLVCRSGTAAPKTIMELQGHAGLSYSLDGLSWSSGMRADPTSLRDGPQSTIKVTPGAVAVYVRLATDDGLEQIVASSEPERVLIRPERASRGAI